jgi:hypothetical protein
MAIQTAASLQLVLPAPRVPIQRVRAWHVVAAARHDSHHLEKGALVDMWPTYQQGFDAAPTYQRTTLAFDVLHSLLMRTHMKTVTDTRLNHMPEQRHACFHNKKGRR